MDLLQGVRDAQAEEPQLQDQDFEQAAPHPEGGFQMPSQEAILQMLEKLNMSDEDKEKIREGLSKNYGRHIQGQNQHSLSPAFIVVPCILILILTFVFFGYKLYRSQTEKERKREEKKKQKQQKKKHK